MTNRNTMTFFSRQITKDIVIIPETAYSLATRINYENKAIVSDKMK